MLDSSAAIVTGNVNLLSLSTCLFCQACVSILCFLAYHCSFGLPTDQVPNQDNLPGINIPVLSHVSSSVHVAEQTWLSSPPPLSFGGLVCIPVCSCVWLPSLLICCTEKCPCQISLRIVTLISAYPYCSHGGTFCICLLKLCPSPGSAYVCSLDSYDRFHAHYTAFSFSLFIILHNFHNFVPPNHSYVFNIVIQLLHLGCCCSVVMSCFSAFLKIVWHAFRLVFSQFVKSKMSVSSLAVIKNISHSVKDCKNSSLDLLSVICRTL